MWLFYWPDRLNLININCKASSGIINSLFSIFFLFDGWRLIVALCFFQIGESSQRIKNIGCKQFPEGKQMKISKFDDIPGIEKKTFIQERKIMDQ